MNISKKAIMSFIVALTSVVAMAQPYYHIMKEENGKLIEDTVYNGMDYNIKIDMNEPKPEDAIGDKITVPCSGRSFYFTNKGNVYYNNSENKFYFEKSQLDYPSGTSYNKNHCGHFRWGHSIKECTEIGSWGFQNWGSETSFYFANPDSLGKLQEDLGNEKWAVLSRCEWKYVCETLGECGWTVDDKTCFLIDTTPEKSLLRAIESKNGGKTMSKADFESYEAQGLVCLPASGTLTDKGWGVVGRDKKGRDIEGWIFEPRLYSLGSIGKYWSCTPDYSWHSGFHNRREAGTWYLDFDSSSANEYHGPMRGNGMAVRLVILAEED